jgi:hypothetical protein
MAVLQAVPAVGAALLHICCQQQHAWAVGRQITIVRKSEYTT